MAHSPDTKNKVRQLYVEGMALTNAAKICSVSIDTARAWKAAALKKGDNWDTQRDTFSIATSNINDVSKQFAIKVVQQSTQLLKEIENGDHELEKKVAMYASMSDSMVKATKSIKRFVPELTEAAASIDTFKLIIEYLRQNDPELLKGFSVHFDGIGNVLRTHYGQ